MKIVSCADFTTEPASATSVQLDDFGGTFVLARGYYGLNGFVLTSNRHFTLRNVGIWACKDFDIETRGPQQY